MVLDLAGKFVEAPQETGHTKARSNKAGNTQLDEAIEALLALGYKAKELKKFVPSLRGPLRRQSNTSNQH